MSKVFNKVGVPKVGKSVFNLSYEKKFVCKMGQLIPSMVDEVVPGDVFDIGKRIVCRLLPLAAPLMHTVYMSEYTFFVPYRLLMNDDVLGDAGTFESMMIGGADGDTDITIPTWTPTTYTVGSLWDYMGFPIGILPAGAYPVDFPKRAYNMIYNEYFRDIEIDTEIDITTSEAVQWGKWSKDYFTSAREDEQRGTSPGLPISGTIDISPKDEDITVKNEADATTRTLALNTSNDVESTTTPSSGGDMRWVSPALQVDLSSATTIDINDLRLAVQTQRWMERNMRAGVRYTELLRAHFGVAPRDDRLDRPEFIGGLKTGIMVSEVLATNDNGTHPIGEMAGHGIAVAEKKIGKYRVMEYGLIMSILCIRPRTAYSQGIDRQWRKDTLYDFYWPEFSNLSEQPILESEIRATATEAENDTVFGYTGRYNEMRVKKDIVCSYFAYNQTYDTWTLGREFGSRPTLNATFLSTGAGITQGGIRKDIFAGDDGNSCMVSVGNIIRAVRPLPVLAMPGYLDHN